MKCTKCGKQLKEKTTVMLLKHVNGKHYFDLSWAPVPENEVVERVPFGKDCGFKIGNVYRKEPQS